MNMTPLLKISIQKLLRLIIKKYCLDILDTAGEEEYSAMRPEYIRKSQCFLAGFSICSRGSFDEIKGRIIEIRQHKKDENYPYILLAGRKSDLESERQVTFAEGKALAKEYRLIDYIEASAKTRDNNDKLFYTMARYVISPDSRKHSLYNWHELALMSDNVLLERYKIYIRVIDGKLAYSVIAPSGKEVRDIPIPKIKAKVPSPFSIEALAPHKEKILDIISEAGHININLISTTQKEANTPKNIENVVPLEQKIVYLW